MTDLPVGSLTRVAASDRRARGICVANVDGTVFAFEDVCPHGGGRLSNGTLVGNVVRCPIHGLRFNLDTGACLGPDARRLMRYPVAPSGTVVTVYSGRSPLRARLWDVGRFLRPRRRRSPRAEPGPTGWVRREG